jgi:hypothetical protein
MVEKELVKNKMITNNPHQTRKTNKQKTQQRLLYNKD